MTAACGTPERVSVSLEVICESASGKRDARMSDVGAGGCYIDCLAPVTVGETVAFKVRLPTGHWLQLRGVVVEQEWHAGFDLRFTDLTEEESALLAEVIKAAPASAATLPVLERVEGGELPRPHRGFGRILVAEDEPVSMRLVTAVIEKHGYAAVPAWDGREACRLLQRDADFAAAIFDMKMPHLKGLDLIHFMQTEKRLMRIPVGVITAEQDPKLWDESIAAGARIFLPKPFDPEQLRFMLRVLLGKGERSVETVK